MNNLTILGHLGRDPEMTYTANGAAVTKFSMAVSRKYTNAGGDRMEHTDWFQVSAWNKLAEVANQYLTKGSPVLVIGRVELDEWDGQDGQHRAALAVTANQLELLGGKRSDGDYNADKVVSSADAGEESEPVAAGGVESVDDMPF